jgi:hypothetical protein
LGQVIKLLSKNKLGTPNIDGCAFGLHKNQKQNFDRLPNILLELNINLLDAHPISFGGGGQWRVELSFARLQQK